MIKNGKNSEKYKFITTTNKNFVYLKYLRIIFISIILVITLQKNEAQVLRGEIIGGVNLSQFDGDKNVSFKRVGANVGLGVVLPFTHRWSMGLEALYSMKGAYQKIPRGGYYSYNLHLDYVEIPLMARFTEKIFTVGLGFSYGRMVNYSETVHGRPLASSLEEAKQIWGEDVISTGMEQPESNQYQIPLDVYNPETGLWKKDCEWSPGMFTDSKMKKNDWSILVDLRFRVWKNLSINLRYSYSLASLRTETYIIGQNRFVYVDKTNRELYYVDNGTLQRNGQFFETRKQHNNTLTLRFIWTLNWNGKTIQDTKKEL